MEIHVHLKVVVYEAARWLHRRRRLQLKGASQALALHGQQQPLERPGEDMRGSAMVIFVCTGRDFPPLWMRALGGSTTTVREVVIDPSVTFDLTQPGAPPGDPPHTGDRRVTTAGSRLTHTVATMLFVHLRWPWCRSP